MPTIVVHCKKQQFDVYIGRPSKWGNPFPISLGRKECIEQYAKWILKQPQLLADLPELVDKRLGCFCAPLACHGDILARLANNLKGGM